MATSTSPPAHAGRQRPPEERKDTAEAESQEELSAYQEMTPREAADVLKLMEEYEPLVNNSVAFAEQLNNDLQVLDEVRGDGYDGTKRVRKKSSSQGERKEGNNQTVVGRAGGEGTHELSLLCQSSVFYCIAAEHDLFQGMVEQHHERAAPSTYLLLMYPVLGFYGQVPEEQRGKNQLKILKHMRNRRP